jgi:hypothetical protein
MRRGIPVAAALGLWLCGGLSGQAGQDDARALLAKAIKAHGGGKALAGLASLQRSGKGKVYAHLNAPFTAELLYQLPHRSKMALAVDYKGKTYAYIQVLDGNKGWVKDFTGKTNPMDAQALREAQQLLTVERAIGLVALKDRSYQLSALGASKVGDRDAVGLRVEKKGCRDVNLYFDKRTHLLLKAEYRALDLEKREVTQAKYFSDYQTLSGGATVPGKMVLKNDGKRFVEIDITETTPVERHDDSAFAEP